MWKLTLGCGILMFAGAQLAPGPSAANPPVLPGRTVQENLHVPEHIARLLERSCMDCHSNQTRWPWYSRVAPGSWMVRTDVANARRAMNFSEWSGHAPRPEMSVGLLAAACANVQSARMPLPRYLMLNPGARLSEEEKRLFCEWTHTEIARLVRERRQARLSAVR
jgi:hypothetical protein